MTITLYYGLYSAFLIKPHSVTLITKPHSVFISSPFPLPSRLKLCCISMTSRLDKHLVTMTTKTDITLYTAQTPNGIKASILLAELGLDYKVRPRPSAWPRLPPSLQASLTRRPLCTSFTPSA